MSARTILLIGLVGLIIFSCDSDEDIIGNGKVIPGTVSFFLFMPKDMVDDGAYVYRVALHFDSGDSCSFAFTKYENPLSDSVRGPLQVVLLDGEAIDYTYSCAIEKRPGTYSLLGFLTARYHGSGPDSLLGQFSRIGFQVDPEANTSLGMFEIDEAVASHILTVPGEFATIQLAVDQAADGDTVLVSPGTYYGKVNFMGKRIVVKSFGGPKVTFITGDSTRYSALVTFNHGETAESILEGFSLYGGWLGVYCEGSGPTIRYNIFNGQYTTEWAAVDLAAPGYPPSAGIGPAPARIINNTIVNCVNGGISTFSTTAPIIRNNIIAFNNHYGIHRQTSMCSLSIGYNAVFGSVMNYQNISDSGMGSISDDPRLNSDFSLRPESPCIDAGDPDPDYNDPGGSRNDMGALPYGE